MHQRYGRRPRPQPAHNFVHQSPLVGIWPSSLVSLVSTQTWQLSRRHQSPCSHLATASAQAPRECAPEVVCADQAACSPWGYAVLAACGLQLVCARQESDPQVASSHMEASRHRCEAPLCSATAACLQHEVLGDACLCEECGSRFEGAWRRPCLTVPKHRCRECCESPSQPHCRIRKSAEEL